MNKKKRTLLTTKITFGFIIAICLLGAVIFFCCQYYNINSAKVFYKNHTISCAKSASNVLFDTKFDNYLKNGKNEKYKEQLEVLNSICKSFGLKYLYVYIPNFEKNEITTLFYVDGKSQGNVKTRDLGKKSSGSLQNKKKTHTKALKTIKCLIPITKWDTQLQAMFLYTTRQKNRLRLSGRILTLTP